MLVARLAEHRRRFGDGPDGLVFHRNDKPFDMDLFARNVWEAGPGALFPVRADLPPGDPASQSCPGSADTTSLRRLLLVAQ